MRARMRDLRVTVYHTALPITSHNFACRVYYDPTSTAVFLFFFLQSFKHTTI